jgi:hypothetical protein
MNPPPPVGKNDGGEFQAKSVHAPQNLTQPKRTVKRIIGYLFTQLQ